MCKHKHIVKNGFHKRKSTKEVIQKYKCKDCGKIIMKVDLIKSKMTAEQEKLIENSTNENCSSRSLGRIIGLSHAQICLIRKKKETSSLLFI